MLSFILASCATKAAYDTLKTKDTQNDRGHIYVAPKSSQATTLQFDWHNEDSHILTWSWPRIDTMQATESTAYAFTLYLAIQLQCGRIRQFLTEFSER